MSITRYTITSIALLSALLAGAGHAEIPELQVPTCATPPAIDGTLEDPCWTQAAAVSNLLVFARGPIGEANHDTRLRVVRDDQWLYVAAECLNPDMQHLTPAGKRHDDGGIWADDALEVLVARGSPTGYGFIVNYINANAERSMGAGGSNIGWTLPWVSATRMRDDGWTAELAIPLFVVNHDASAPLRINFVRNRMVVTKDRMGAKLGEKKMLTAWSLQDMNPNTVANFGIVKGIDDLRAEPVFLPQVTDLEFLDYALGAGVQANWIARLEGFTDVPGKVTLTVKLDRDKPAVFSKNIDMPAQAAEDVAFSVAVNQIASGKALLQLSDTTSGQVLQTLPLVGPGNLISDVVPDRDFYTTESSAKIRCQVALSDPGNCTLRVEGGDGKVLAEASGLSTENELNVPLKTFAPGTNSAKVRLLGPDGATIDTQDVDLVRRKPRPGREVKIDHFRRTILRNGKPFFLFGMKCGMDRKGMVHSDTQEGADVFRLIKDTGFNTVLRGYYRIYQPSYDFATQHYMDLAREYDLTVIDWNNDFVGVDRAEDPQKCYTNYLAAAVKDIEIVSTYTNLLGYWNVDEPNLGNWRGRLDVCHWLYKDMKRLDPYRPVFGLFACAVPRADDALEPFDALGYDPYIYPGWRDYGRGDINFVAQEVFELEQRVAPLHKPLFMVLIGTALDPSRCPLGLSYQEQLNQAYASMIYGAKGIVYFAKIFTWGEHSWRAFRTLRNHLDVLEPAILAERPDVDLSYPDSDVNPARGIFPLVHVGLFRYPDGRHVLLAANGKQFPVDVEVRIPGLKAGSRLFGTTATPAAAQGSWAARIEPLGVRAVELEIENPGTPLQVSATETGRPDMGPPPREPLEDVFARVSARKNKMPNPSFELKNKIAGAPDFFQPWLVKDAERIGDSGFEYWGLDSENPKFGEHSMRLSCPEETAYANGMWCVAYLPDGDYPRNFTFSLYMRGAKGGEKIHQAILGNRANFKLTTDWQRYSMKLNIKKRPRLGRAGFHINPPKGTTIWLDGLQWEEGISATDFEPE